MGIKLRHQNANYLLALVTLILSLLLSSTDGRQIDGDFYQLDDYYNKNNSNNGAFVQIPHSNPPTVRPPPYTISDKKCPRK